MRGLLWLLTLFALAAGVSLAAHFNDGYLLLVLPPYRAEISLNLTILILLGSFIVLYAVLRGMVLMLSLPRRVREFRQRRRQERMNDQVYDVARLLFEGRYSLALKKAEAAHAAGRAPALAALFAAHAAQRLSEPVKQKSWLERACQLDPEMRVASLMLEAEMLIDRQQYAEAIALLKNIKAESGRHIAALRLELRAQQGCANWDEVLRLARLLEKRQALPAHEMREIKDKAHRENIRLHGMELASLYEYQRKMPERERDPELALAYADALIALNANEAARDFIEDQLNATWDSRLLTRYALARGGESLPRIARAEYWLPQHRDDAELLLVLGRLCLEQQLWGKAQSYLEASLSLRDQREVRLELARLFERNGRAEDAMPHYRAAAELPR